MSVPRCQSNQDPRAPPAACSHGRLCLQHAHEQPPSSKSHPHIELRKLNLVAAHATCSPTHPTPCSSIRFNSLHPHHNPHLDRLPYACVRTATDGDCGTEKIDRPGDNTPPLPLLPPPVHSHTMHPHTRPHPPVPRIHACTPRVRACVHACVCGCVRGCVRAFVRAWLHACVRARRVRVCVRACMRAHRVRACVRACVRAATAVAGRSGLVPATRPLCPSALHPTPTLPVDLVRACRRRPRWPRRSGPPATRPLSCTFTPAGGTPS